MYDNDFKNAQTFRTALLDLLKEDAISFEFYNGLQDDDFSFAATVSFINEHDTKPNDITNKLGLVQHMVEVQTEAGALYIELEENRFDWECMEWMPPEDGLYTRVSVLRM